MNQEKTRFESLFKKYYTPFCFYANKFIVDWECCEDIVSDVFAKLWIDKDDISLNEKSAVAYLRTCIKNRCLNTIKHQEVKQKYKDETLFLHSNYEDTLISLEELYQKIHEKLQELSEQQRSALFEQFYNNKTQEEIAQELNLSSRTIGRYKKETLKYLKEELSKHIFTLTVASVYLEIITN